VARLDELHANRVDEVLARFDPGLKVKRSEGAKSGVAIRLELTGLYGLRDQMATRARPRDVAVIQALVATQNYLARSGQISLRQTPDGSVTWTPWLEPIPALALVPESSINVAYPHYWTSDERVQVRADLLEAVDAGRESPRALWLLDHDLEDDRPNGLNWQVADESIRTALADASAYASLGYGLDWSARAQAAAATVVDEAQRYTPPVDVADTAAKGLGLREDFPGRALTGSPPSPQTMRLLKRAKGLRDQVPMLLGEVRELSQWLATHGRAPEDAGWGDDTNPSGPYITWLTQGGDAAQAWTAEVLNGPQ
jgi:hypothetical protein